jgi:hypothetical protein
MGQRTAGLKPLFSPARINQANTSDGNDGSNHDSIDFENQSPLLVGSAERSSAFAPGFVSGGNHNASDQLRAVALLCLCGA